MIDLKTSDINDRFRKNFLGFLNLNSAPDVPREKPKNKRLIKKKA